MKLIDKLKAKTPKAGNKIAKVGVMIAGFGATAEFLPPEMIEFIPERLRVYYSIAVVIAGVITTIYGKAQVEEKGAETP